MVPVGDTLRRKGERRATPEPTQEACGKIRISRNGGDALKNLSKSVSVLFRGGSAPHQSGGAVTRDAAITRSSRTQPGANLACRCVRVSQVAN